MEKNLKNYTQGIIYGIISILMTLLLTGIPLGNSHLEIVNIILYIVGLILVLYLGLIIGNDKATLITMIGYLIVSGALTIYIECTTKYEAIFSVGFLSGLIVSFIGLIRTNAVREKYYVRFSFIINSLALLLAVASLVLIFVNGGLIVQIVYD